MTLKTRKTNKRTLQTKEIIKSALLILMKKKPFMKLSVTELCKLININRGTFYLHYLDLYDVLDDILEELFHNTSSVIDHILCPERISGKCGYPFCEMIHTKEHYQPIFLDESISSILMEKTSNLCKEPFITWLMAHSHLTFEKAEALFYFQMNGCLAINRLALKNHCTDWRKIQETVDQFIKAGFESFIGQTLQ